MKIYIKNIEKLNAILDLENSEGDGVIGKYKITYHNGVVQEKNLISSKDFHNFIIPIRNEIHELECEKKYSEAKYLKSELKNIFGSEYFTDDSPIYYAIKTGILCLPLTQGGCKSCEVIEI